MQIYSVKRMQIYKIMRLYILYIVNKCIFYSLGVCKFKIYIFCIHYSICYFMILKNIFLADQPASEGSNLPVTHYPKKSRKNVNVKGVVKVRRLAAGCFSTSPSCHCTCVRAVYTSRRRRGDDRVRQHPPNVRRITLRHRNKCLLVSLILLYRRDVDKGDESREPAIGVIKVIKVMAMRVDLASVDVSPVTN